MLKRMVLPMTLLLGSVPALAQHGRHDDFHRGLRDGGRGGRYGGGGYDRRGGYDDHGDYREHHGGIGPGKGALIGAGGGAVLGALFGGGLKGTIIGGAAGAGIGGILGKEHQNHVRRRDRYYR